MSEENFLYAVPYGDYTEHHLENMDFMELVTTMYQMKLLNY